MAYIGKQPIVGNYQVLDALTASATATYALTKNSVAVFPQTPANCIVSLNGVIQAPFDSYTISGSNIVFASALTGSDSIDFITVLGDVLNVGTVSDSTITTAKLADSSVTTAKLNDASVSLAKLTATGTKDATTFLRGDNTFATISNSSFSQIVTSQNTNVPSGSGTGYIYTSSFAEIDSRFRLTITPTSTNHKILLFCTCGLYNSNEAGGNQFMTLYRDAVNLGDATGGLQNQTHDAQLTPFTFVVVDSPNTVSAITYKLFVKNSTASSGTYLNNGGGGQNQFIAMEFLG